MQDAMMIDETTVRERAYAMWEAAGCPEGCEQQHWLQAEEAVRQESAASPVVAAPRRAARKAASAK
ncbi:MAG: DUF2934 domain-containing protein [Acetobacteraceae bacterium]|nr:MAG: DUF2934 domain-containing protein [Acetobacteraceae bacterium]